jgi:hypothetical protein
MLTVPKRQQVVFEIRKNKTLSVVSMQWSRRFAFLKLSFIVAVFRFSYMWVILKQWQVVYDNCFNWHRSVSAYERERLSLCIWFYNECLSLRIRFGNLVSPLECCYALYEKIIVHCCLLSWDCDIAIIQNILSLRVWHCQQVFKLRIRFANLVSPLVCCYVLYGKVIVPGCLISCDSDTNLICKEQTNNNSNSGERIKNKINSKRTTWLRSN